MPQQRNSNDCGMYVLAVARMLCESFAQAGSAAGAASGADWLADDQEAALLKGITPAAVTEMRQQLLGIIRSLAESAAGTHN